MSDALILKTEIALREKGGGDKGRVKETYKEEERRSLG